MKDKKYLLLGTRKGLVVYQLKNNEWQFQETHFKGIPVTIAYVDERNDNWWACLDHGHWGVKLHRSSDQGKNWTELQAPAYPEGSEIKEGVPAATKYIWAMQHGGHDNPNRIWLGTIPGGLFRSEDGGDTFELVKSLWDHPSRDQWFGAGFDHPGIHSIIVDPNDSDHLFVGISCAGVFESTDAGATWVVRNKGLSAPFLPDPNAEVGHDPHMLVANNKSPNVMWQQNHVGIYRSNDGGKQWIDVSEKDGPASFGFAMVVSEEDADKAWVMPCISDEIRIAYDEALVICRTDDGGKNWQSFRKGLPQDACYDIVYRHGLAAHQNWVAFGTTCGNAFISSDHGESWKSLNSYLPMVHSVQFG